MLQKDVLTEKLNDYRLFPQGDTMDGLTWSSSINALYKKKCWKT